MPVRPHIRRLVEPEPGSSRRIPAGVGRGVRIAAEPAETASADLWVGLFESELGEAVRRMARPGTRCVDVGANSGFYTLVFARRTQSPVTAYEPDPAARARLQRNLTLNPHLAPFVDLRGSLVGAASRGADGSPAGDPSLAAALPTVALDDDLADPHTIGLIKVDVDGPEAEVLAGAAGILASRRPHVIVETHSAQLEADCAARLTAAGYRPRVLTARRLAPQDRGADHNRWLVATGRG